MKNKLYYIFLLVLSFFSFMNNIFAEELNFSVTATVVGGNTTVVPGEEVAIDVALNSEDYISTCTFEILQDSGIESVSKLGMNNYFVEAGETKLVIDRSVTDTDFTSGQNVLELKYKVNNDGKVTIKTLDCTSPVGNKVGTYQDIVVEFKTEEVVDDTTLSSLTVTAGTLLTEFSPNQYEYLIDLDSSNFSIKMTTSNPLYQNSIVLADVEGNVLNPNNITFNNDGDQGLMRMTVTINNNGLKQYILVARYEQKELDNSLASLKINGTEIKLSENKVDYTFKVDADVFFVSIEATLRDNDNFQFRDGNEPGIFVVSNGTTSIALMIVPKNSQIGAESKTYTIDIIKEGSSGTTNNGTNDGNTNIDNSGNNTTTNPGTGRISMFVMLFILVVSLVSSIFLYQRNLEGYNK